MASDDAKIFTRDFCLLFVSSFATTAIYYLTMTLIAAYAISMFQCSDAAAGLAASVFMVGGVVGRLVCGWIPHRRVRFWGIAGLVLMLAACLAYQLVHLSYALLIVVRLTHGLAFGVAGTLVPALAVERLPRERMGEGTGYYMLSVTLATALGPLAGMVVRQGFDYGALFALCAVVVAIGLFTALLVPDVKSPDAVPGESAGAASARGEGGDVPAADKSADANAPELSAPGKPVPAAAASKGANSSDAIAPETIAADKPAPVRFSLKTVLDANTWKFSVFMLIMGISYMPINAFLETYSMELGLHEFAPFVFFLYAATLLVTRPVAGRIMDRRGANAVLYPSMISMAVALAVCAAACNAPMLLSVGVLMATGFGTTMTIAQAQATKMTESGGVSRAIATMFLFTDLGSATGPALMGVIAGIWGFRVMFASCVGVVALALAYYHFISRKYVDASNAASAG